MAKKASNAYYKRMADANRELLGAFNFTFNYQVLPAGTARPILARPILTIHCTHLCI